MMPSITFALGCPVCLDTLRNPVAPPCGHPTCELCIKQYISLSTNPYEARCPTCRASFPTVLPNLSLIPNRYHVFINPPLRRVYLGDMVDNNKAVIDDLKSKIVCIQARIETLKSNNENVKREAQLALDKANAEAQLALDNAKEARHALDKANKDAQLTLEMVKDELRLANSSLEECRAENNILRSKVLKFRSVGNTSGRSASNTPRKDTSPRCSNCATKSSPTRVQLLPADQPFDFGLANDIRLVSAAQEALVVLSYSSTSPSTEPAPSVSLAQSGSSTVGTGSDIPSHATNQVTTAIVADESGEILDPSPTPPLLYPYPTPPLAHISLDPTQIGHSEQLGTITDVSDFGMSAH